MAVVVPIISKFDDSGIKKLKGGLKGLKGAVGGAIAAMGLSLGISQLKDFAKEASLDIKSQQLLAATLKRTANATDASIKSTEGFITKLQNTTGILDDDLRPAMANFARVTGSSTKAQELLAIAVDASAMSGKPLEAVSKAIAKAHAGQTTSLIRMFPELKKSKNALKDLAKESKGFGELRADPFMVMDANLSDLKETIGRAVLPAMVKMFDYLQTNVLPVVEKFFDDLGNPKSDISKALEPVQTAFKNLGTAVSDFAKTDMAKEFGPILKESFLASLKILAWTLDTIANALKLISGVNTGPFKAIANIKDPKQKAAAEKAWNWLGTTPVDTRTVNPGSSMSNMSNVTINVNGVVGDKASVGKAVKEAMTAYDKKNGSIYRGGR